MWRAAGSRKIRNGAKSAAESKMYVTDAAPRKRAGNFGDARNLRQSRERSAAE